MSNAAAAELTSNKIKIKARLRRSAGGPVAASSTAADHTDQ